MASVFSLSDVRVVERPKLLYKMFGEKEMEFCVLLLEVAEDGAQGRAAKFYRVPVECWGQVARRAVELAANEVLRGVSGVIRSRRWVGKKYQVEHYDVVLKATSLNVFEN